MCEGVEMEALSVQGVASGWVLVGSGCVLGDGCRGTHGQYRGEENLAFCSLIPAGLEAWSAKKGLTVALWISQVLLT